ncbi:origin recognition complex subunit 1 [Spea bombifrons]|uniref:origin recognition complex subunit 1 n=1 Tax=Spea bombifrons TaxID=233779 RepID=UPI002349698F|nr:origin recognition complex subunit 1 [Spea bombifrons]XP_053325095.1 origin recognition complex subunit 1 [Spea bombifrons]
MTRYFTRVKRRRQYIWNGKPLSKDRRVQNLHYGGLLIKSESNEITVCPGNYVLIEGEDEERPFVARLKELYDDGTDKGANKHATVQWFLRYEEVPYKKRKLLGRDPDPQEIFLYDVAACENDIDAETIIGAVQVLQLNLEDPFPTQNNLGAILYVKLSWDGKNFKPLTSSICQDDENTDETNGPVVVKSPPKPLFPLEGDTAEIQQMPRSASRSKKNETEIESRHSASKSSHSKERRAQRVPSVSSTPGARKKLQLNSPSKSSIKKDIQHDILADDDFKALESVATKRKVAFSGLRDSPPKKAMEEEELAWSITPLKSAKDSQRLKLNLKLTPLRPVPQSANLTSEQGSKKCADESENSRITRSKTPQKESAKKNLSRPSKRLEEEQEKTAPQTPRSRRKSARESASRVRKQLKSLAESDEDVDDDDKDFVPAKENHVFVSSDEEKEEEVTSPKRSRKKSTTPRTPTSSRKSSSRTPSKTPVSRTPRAATPRIPERNQPVRTPANVLEEARIRLHVSAVPESLPCREQEYQDVYNFVESKLLDGTGGCMYISGVPGTGKTATVHEVIRCLQQAVEEEDVLPPFQYIEINGMKLTDPHQAYVQILKLLTGEKATADHAAALLEKRFSTPASKRETTVLLVDELDLLWTRKQNVMYSLFDWPTRKHAKLIVLAIANTMDLPERIMMNRVASRLGLTRMSFQPYTHKQLQQIITSRLNHVKAFDDDAIQLVSRKVAALSGDARRCLDICRRATEICEFSSKKDESSLVKMPHVIEALEEMFSSPYVIAIKNASVMEQTFLRAVIAEFRRSGLEEATLQKVFQQHVALCRIEGMQPPSMSETMAVCLRLGASRLLLVESSRNDLHMRVRINVSQDDIMYALKDE